MLVLSPLCPQEVQSGCHVLLVRHRPPPSLLDHLSHNQVVVASTNVELVVELLVAHVLVSQDVPVRLVDCGVQQLEQDFLGRAEELSTRQVLGVEHLLSSEGDAQRLAQSLDEVGIEILLSGSFEGGSNEVVDLLDHHIDDVILERVLSGQQRSDLRSRSVAITACHRLAAFPSVALRARRLESSLIAGDAMDQQAARFGGSVGLSGVRG